MNRKEYTVINLIAEYEGRIAEFKYAVSSALPEEKLRKKYGTELKKYEPFLYLTADQGQAIMDSIRNNDKHLKRQKNTYDYFGYSDGATELRHVESIYLQSPESDPLEKLITEESEREWEMHRREDLPKLRRAMEELSEVQRRRVDMYYFKKMTKSEIAEAENISRVACSVSLKRALRRLRSRMGVTE